MEDRVKTISFTEYNSLKQELESKYGKGTTYKDMDSNPLLGKSIIYKDIEYYCPEA